MPQYGTCVELTADLKRAWVDGVELEPGTFMVVTPRKAFFMGVLNKTPSPLVQHVFIYADGFAELERIPERAGCGGCGVVEGPGQTHDFDCPHAQV